MSRLRVLYSLAISQFFILFTVAGCCTSFNPPYPTLVPSTLEPGESSVSLATEQPEDLPSATSTAPPPPTISAPTIASSTSGLQPTSSATCEAPAGWISYIVEPGDTLFRLSLNTQTTVLQVKEANCLVGDVIYVGQQLYLPGIPASPTLPPASSTDTPIPPTATDTPVPLPLVVLMDGTDRAIVYHPETFEAERTNAHDVADILSDLPIETRVEVTSAQWDEEVQIRALDPELIIIHASAFYPHESYGEKFASFLRYMADTQTDFLIYSRSLGYRSDGIPFRDEAEKRAFYEEEYQLHGRVQVLLVLGLRWDTNGIEQILVDKVSSILSLD